MNAIDLVQQIIWRTKALHGADVSTAPEFLNGISDKPSDLMAFYFLMDLLVFNLRTKMITKVVAGCTELPQAFNLYYTMKMAELENKQVDNQIVETQDPYPLLGLRIIDPASAVAGVFGERKTS